MILLIGYGNPLRRDDAIGQHLAQLMSLRLSGDVQAATAYQLTPEWVEPIRHARLVVFIDARVGETPGTLFQEVVTPENNGGAFTHHVTPGSLLGAADELYGANPAGILISIVGADFAYGDALSPLLMRMLSGIADQVEAIIRAQVRDLGLVETITETG